MILRKWNSRPRKHLRAGLVLFSVLAAFTGCERSTQPPPAKAPPPEHVYTVRGEVVALPTPTSSLRIRHEAIPDFARKDGSRGMNAMVMEFPTASGLSLEGLEPGDKVEFVLEHWVDPRIRYQVTRIAELPPETVLDFGRRP